MGIVAVYCTLSARRLVQLEEEPELLEELLEARHEDEIPGLLDLGKSWDALDHLISERGRDPILGDAVLARSGQTLEAHGAHGPARLLEPEQVKKIAAALEALPKSVIADRYDSLFGKEIHGRYGQDRCADDEIPFIKKKIEQARAKEIGELEEALTKLIALYRSAAEAGHHLMVVLT